MEKRFSPGCRWYLTGVSLFAYVFTKISVSLFAGGILIREIVGWDYMTSAILLVVATGIYTIFGGLAAVISSLIAAIVRPNCATRPLPLPASRRPSTLVMMFS